MAEGGVALAKAGVSIGTNTLESAALSSTDLAMATEKPGVLVTGLDLDAIPMQTRPLPTATSPEWFIKSYQVAFQKFYGLKTIPVFQ
jgi:hypothetical protein